MADDTDKLAPKEVKLPEAGTSKANPTVTQTPPVASKASIHNIGSGSGLLAPGSSSGLITSGPGGSEEAGASSAFPRETIPTTTAKANFRRIAAFLSVSRRQEELQKLSPGIKALVDEKEKKNQAEEKIDKNTGLPNLKSTSQDDKRSRSLFSDDFRIESKEFSIRTEMFENAASAYVVSDPVEKHYLVESMTNRLYAYFLSMLALIGVLNAIAIYGLFHLPAIFTEHILSIFFWRSTSNVLLMFATLMWWSLVGNMFLICPRQRDWPRSVRKVRWFLLLIPFVIMHICHIGWDINLARLDNEFLPALESEMFDNIHGKNNATLLKSQTYFGCCGVKDYKDWMESNSSNLYHGGFPLSCCSGSAGRHGCRVPIHTHSKDGEFQLWPEGCLRSEKKMLISIVMITYVFLTGILISMYVALFHLVMAINIILEHDIIVPLPF